MGWLSKAWSGIKKRAKKAARGIKKLSKKIAFLDPVGKKTWELTSKWGKSASKKVMKFVDKIGPVGMIALSILAPYAAPLWTAFGAMATAAGGFWGAVGTAVYNAGNFVAGTLGSMTSGISEAIGHLGSGAIKEAGSAAVKGFADAFTGKAGQSAVQEGLLKAAGKAATDMVVTDAAGQLAADQAAEQSITTQAPSAFDTTIPTDAVMQQPAGGGFGQGMMDQTPIASQSIGTPTTASETMSGLSSAGTPQTAAYEGATTKAVETGGGSLLSDAADIAKKGLEAYSSLQSEGIGGYQPIGAVGGGGLFGTRGAAGEGGIGSGGGEFLSQQMRQRIAEEAARMSRGYGGMY